MEFESFPEMVRLLFKPDTIPQMYTHAAIGIVGEAIELHFATDLDNVVEELGDVGFYLQALCMLRGRDLAGFISRERPLGMSMLEEAQEILDTIKKYAIYGAPLNESRLDHHLANLAACYFAKLRVFGLTWEFVRDANMRKLEKRYHKGSFSTDQAVRRADKSGVSVGNENGGKN